MTDRADGWSVIIVGSETRQEFRPQALFAESLDDLRYAFTRRFRLDDPLVGRQQ